MKNKITNCLAVFFLILMFGFAFFSLKGDSASMDELAHIPAGYSYVSQNDMRLNPEHPPLLKDLAGWSIQVGSQITKTPINFPAQAKSWTEDINGQWSFGHDFLYNSANDADKIILWARIPMILLTLLLGFYVFKWTQKLYGRKAALLALLLFSFSPTFLAHSRYVTTDVGAAFAFFFATFYLIKWLQKQNFKNLIIAGLAFGTAMLIKFSLALIIPYFILITFVWLLVNKWSNFKTFSQAFLKTMFGLVLVGLIGLILIGPIYQYHLINLPVEKQQAEAIFHTQGSSYQSLADLAVWLADKPFLRTYSQYLVGLLMVIQRTGDGNTTYFLGEVNLNAWPHYFPVVYLLKVPLAFHLLSLIALISALAAIRIKKQARSALAGWLKKHFTEFALLTFISIYWLVSIKSNLNIGIRHILPVFPFGYVLVSGQIIKWLKFKIPPRKNYSASLKSILSRLKDLSRSLLSLYFKQIILLILIGWYLVSSLTIFPHYLAYFNQLAGGPSQGYRYVNDSNLDWGQDLKRLAHWVNQQEIDYIYLDYFGGGNPDYYLADKYRPWWGHRSQDEFKTGDYLAVSATFLQQGRAVAGPDFSEPTDFYVWLDQHQFVQTIGYSIFIYQIN